MKDLKILILFFYYARPKLVRGALQSILDSTYKNWEVAFIDDTEDPVPGDKVSNEFMGDDSRFRYIWTGDTDEAKGVRGGSNFGKTANEVMQSSDADICISCCDDDFLMPGYLEKLNEYYKANPEVMYSYCHFTLYNPIEEKYEDIKQRTEASNYLNWTHPINPFCQIDSSQGSHRLQEGNKAEIFYPHPQTTALDSVIFSKMFNNWGPAVFNGILGQAKGWFPKQLGKRPCPYEDTE